MPQTMARAVGLQGKENLVQAFGLREIATGVGLLMARDPEPWVWGRVAGDALDLGALTAGLRHDNPYRFGTAVAMLAVAQVAAVDVACAKALASHREQAENEWRYIDYRDRRGFDKPVQEIRGAALSDFSTPDDYRIPPALRPWEARELPAGGLNV
jgi:hypothetical protein